MGQADRPVDSPQPACYSDYSMSLAPHERYVYKPFPGSSHSWALLQAGRLKPGKLLDIGPGSGAIGMELKSRGWADISAVEVDEASRAHLAATYTSVSGDLSFYSGRKFDLVLLLDVLEHMADPLGFLHMIPPLVADDGVVLVSVPNVAHWSVRGMLLLGRFDYTSRGILDRTHLQFFTRRRFLALLNNLPGLRLHSISASIEPAELLLPGWIVRTDVWSAFCRLRAVMTRLAPGLFAYQHLAVLRKR